MIDFLIKQKVKSLIKKQFRDFAYTYKNEMVSIANMIDNLTDKEIEEQTLSARKSYSNTVANSMLDAMRFVSEKTYAKTELIIMSPSICGYPDLFDEGFVPAGASYAICYNAMTGKIAESRDCIIMNHWANDYANKVLNGIKL